MRTAIIAGSRLIRSIFTGTGNVMGKRSKTKSSASATPSESCASDKSSAGDTEKYTFFWKIQSPFSQWHPATFVVDDVTYSCAEQYMMHQKAVLFHDEEMAKKILETDKPKAMKAFGRKVKNFDPKLWSDRCRGVVKRGNMAKFSQNSDLKAKLFATKPNILVEASPRDRIWGIGLGASNPMAQKKATWRGKNWLGYTLTEVRDELMQGGSDGSSGGAHSELQSGNEKGESLKKADDVSDSDQSEKSGDE
ncbi:N-glycosidase YbiA-like [Ptychodera flava]|uniref:N-glycosidase YbiA-like n=1 Tax=Ptychodera flava TaxID=63121 RepID=UPI00396A8691